MPSDRVKCKECHWKGKLTELLQAKNPFDSEYTITGCPECKSVDSTSIVCDEPGCWENISCGTPTKNGYRSTCHKHAPSYEIGTP